MNKKALMQFNVMMWIPRLVFMVVVISSILLLVGLYFKMELTVSRAESELFMQRLLYSPHGLSFYDPYSNRIYPGIIDVNNLDLINKSLFYGENKHIGAKLTLTDMNNNVLAERTYYYLVYRRIAQEGKGGVDVFRKALNVVIKNESKQIPGILRTEIVIIQK